MVFHFAEQGVQRFRVEGGGTVFIRVCQRVSLVDEQHAAVGVPADLGHLRGSVTHILGDQIHTLILKEHALAQNAALLEHLTQNARHGGLAGARIAHKAHVDGGPGGRSRTFDGVFDQRDDLVDLLGHRFHADELAELVLGGQIH